MKIFNFLIFILLTVVIVAGDKSFNPAPQSKVTLLDNGILGFTLTPLSANAENLVYEVEFVHIEERDEACDSFETERNFQGTWAISTDASRSFQRGIYDTSFALKGRKVSLVWQIDQYFTLTPYLGRMIQPGQLVSTFSISNWPFGKESDYIQVQFAITPMNFNAETNITLFGTTLKLKSDSDVNRNVFELQYSSLCMIDSVQKSITIIVQSGGSRELHVELRIPAFKSDVRCDLAAFLIQNDGAIEKNEGWFWGLLVMSILLAAVCLGATAIICSPQQLKQSV
eukprot:TRINITY_DN378_c3_g1_i1.p1 TRINITY_DN378_c3_g1~~TRINITY_DN378_c3_g1_i1.p1  ORF type:complete len:284 (-),score=140.23 TRINITY_DN378_c3_g1_i1:110-961(-)